MSESSGIALRKTSQHSLEAAGSGRFKFGTLLRVGPVEEVEENERTIFAR
jgi:hypothetical protein